MQFGGGGGGKAQVTGYYGKVKQNSANSRVVLITNCTRCLTLLTNLDIFSLSVTVYPFSGYYMLMIHEEYAVFFVVNFYCTDNMHIVQERYMLYPLLIDSTTDSKICI